MLVILGVAFVVLEFAFVVKNWNIIKEVFNV